jgi:hypothetical protein
LTAVTWIETAPLLQVRGAKVVHKASPILRDGAC